MADDRRFRDAPPMAKPGRIAAGRIYAGSLELRPAETGAAWEMWKVVPRPWSCPRCLALDSAVLPRDAGPFPPLHPNCACIRIPVSLDHLQPHQLLGLAAHTRRRLEESSRDPRLKRSR